jgi:addiction module RelE/StbE family toxin
MKKPAKREVQVAFSEGFEASFQDLVKQDTKPAERFKHFMRCKREIPPQRLPNTMRDHSLDGALSWLKECHLDGDVLLLYTHENDIVTLYRVCTHDQIRGKRGAKLAALLRR